MPHFDQKSTLQWIAWRPIVCVALQVVIVGKHADPDTFKARESKAQGGPVEGSRIYTWLMHRLWDLLKVIDPASCFSVQAHEDALPADDVVTCNDVATCKHSISRAKESHSWMLFLVLHACLGGYQKVHRRILQSQFYTQASDGLYWSKHSWRSCEQSQWITHGKSSHFLFFQFYYHNMQITKADHPPHQV